METYIGEERIIFRRSICLVDNAAHLKAYKCQ